MPRHRFHLTRLSANIKLGGIPASTTSSSTCPSRCGLQKNGCYAETGNLFLHWKKVSDGTRGTDLDTFCAEIRALPEHQLWRWAQAGDLPGDGWHIDAQAMHKLVSSNRGRNGYGYTHYDPRLVENALAIQYANQQGFTISLSAETLEEADEYVAMGIAPVVVILPAGQTESLKTLAGHTVVVCPASTGDMTCATCGICAIAHRKAIIGFPAHGTSKKKAEAVFWAKKEELQAA